MTPKQRKRAYQVAVIGGGVSGAAMAFGLRKLGLDVVMLDEAPGELGTDKASRGNMGLIWCQSKFAHFPAYARLGFLASALYAELVAEIEELSGLCTRYRPSGGLIPCLGEADTAARSAMLDALRSALGTDYPAEIISRSELETILPRIPFGPEVSGAVWCAQDGYIDPLLLLYALRRAFVRLGGNMLPASPVGRIRKDGASYRLHTPSGWVRAAKVVLATGLSNKKLAASMGLVLPLFADRGQVLLTERIPDILPVPILGITRTPGGTVMIGFMHERAGSDTRLVPDTVIREGHWALRVWPDLGRLRIIRSWSGLRVMPEDGQPIYDTVPGHPGLYLINAHSGVTLAPIHARLLPPWINGTEMPPETASFSLHRFQSNQPEESP